MATAKKKVITISVETSTTNLATALDLSKACQIALSDVTVASETVAHKVEVTAVGVK